MDQRFRVRLGDELVAFGLEPLLDALVVLDDAVVDGGEGTLGVRVGVGVDVIRLAVRRPACVGNADRALKLVPTRVRRRLQALHLSELLAHLQRVLVEHAEPRAVVAAVLKRFRPLMRTSVACAPR